MTKTDLDPHGPPPVEPFNLAALVPPEKILAPGIYFNLSEEDYHASFGLSYSGIKHLRVSPYDWWVRSPLNPNQAEVLEEESNSFAKDLGKAFDARIVCGREYFDAHYAPSISHDDYKDSLRTVDDLKGWLEQNGLPKSGKTKDELIARVLGHDPSAKIWEAIEQGYYEQQKGKEFLEPKMLAKIETAAALIEKHPDLAKAFQGGAPQVSIIWECEATGVLCRARLDYLKPKVIVDLKTLQARDGAPLEASIGKEIGNRKYYIQAAFYLEAAAQIPGFIRAGKVFGTPPDGLLESLAKNPDKQWLWIIQLKGVAPIAKGRTLPKESTLLQLGNVETDNAKHLFRECLNTYGALPWVAPEPIRAMDDSDVPAWSLL